MNARDKDVISRVVSVLRQSGEMAGIDRALELLVGAGRDRGVDQAAVDVLCEVASHRSGRPVRSLEEATGWILGIPGGNSLARLLLNTGADDPSLASTVVLLVAQRLARGSEHPVEDFADAKVVSLDRFLIEHWKKARSQSGHEWLYHPRRTNLSSLVVRKFLADLIAACPQVKGDAEQGRLACDLNVEFSARGRKKTLDCVLGHPLEQVQEAVEPDHPLRKARLAEPIITIEVKSCMTAHRQANSRLIDELHSSVEVVKSQSRETIPVAIVIVNVSPTFTNPLNLPGPNKHVPVEVARVFERVVERVQLDRGGGTEVAYGGLGIVVVDTDNERRVREASREGRVPASHTYERTVGRVAALYARRIKG